MRTILETRRRAQRLLLLCILTLAASCATGRVSTRGGGAVLHVVCFTFEDSAIERADGLAEFYRERVARQPGVLSLYVGKPLTTPNQAGVRGWTLLTSTLFESAAAERAWQKDPLHAALKQRFSPHLRSVQVFDAVE